MKNGRKLFRDSEAEWHALTMQRRVSMFAASTCRPVGTPRDGMPPAAIAAFLGLLRRCHVVGYCKITAGAIRGIGSAEGDLGMHEKRTVVYAARRVRDADLLKMKLARSGVDATILGWEAGSATTLAGAQPKAVLAVLENDLEAACGIATEFEQERYPEEHRREKPATQIEESRTTEFSAPEHRSIMGRVASIYRAGSLVEAHQLRQILYEAGISARVNERGCMK